MPQSLHRTWTALAVAALAVLLVAFLVGRDFVRDVYPECAVSLQTGPFDGEESASLVPVALGATDQYVVKGRHTVSDLRTDFRDAFVIKHGPARHLQADRIFTAHHLPALVVWLALGALGVALVRSRRAMSYALRLHAWTEARLTTEGLIEGESGEPLGTLEQSRGPRVPAGPVLVAPDALSAAGLYRDMPIVQRRSVAEGTHARWASGTMLRLRDARALAVISTLCTLLAFGARLLA